MPQREFHHILVLPGNTHGKDYLIGDIHGCLNELNDQIAKAGIENLNSSVKNRLIPAGDICDRGPDTLKCYHRIDDVNKAAEQRGDDRPIELPAGNHEKDALTFCLNRIKVIEKHSLDNDPESFKAFLAASNDIIEEMLRLKNIIGAKNQSLMEYLSANKMEETFNYFYAMHQNGQFEELKTHLEATNTSDAFAELLSHKEPEEQKKLDEILSSGYRELFEYIKSREQLRILDNKPQGPAWAEDLPFEEYEFLIPFLSQLPIIIRVEDADPFNVVHAKLPFSVEELERRIAVNQLDLSDEDIDTALWARDEGNYPRVQNHQMPLDGPITYCGHTINGGPSFDNHVNLDVGTFDSGCVLRVCHQDKDCELFASESTLQNKPNKMIAPLNIQERVKTFLETREEYINKLRNDELAATTSTSRNSSISSSISSLNMTIPFSHPPLPPTPIEIIQRKKSKELTLDDLIFAVRQNNPDLIHKIAISGFNLNSKDSNEMYPVQIAILEGRNEALKALADAGADLSVQNPAKTQTLQQLALSIDQDKKGMIGIINNTNSMRRDLDEIYKQLSPYISKLNNMSYYYDTLKNPSKTENSEAAILKQLKEQLVPIYSSITNSKLAISEKAEKMKDIGAIVENAETEINKIPRSFTSQIKGLGKASSHAPNVLRTVVHELKQDLGLKLLIEDLDKINKPATLLKPNPASSNAGNI